jgi:Putative Actinobacterial Holin-X, holin superfamily III
MSSGTSSGRHSALPAAAAEPSVGELVAAASRDLSELLRDEVALAKAEVADSAKSAGKGAGMLGAAGFLGVVAFVLLSIAAAYGLVALGLHPALAFLVVAVVYLLVAGVLGLLGKSAVSKAKPPERAIRQAKQLPQALKPHARA